MRFIFLLVFMTVIVSIHAQDSCDIRIQGLLIDATDDTPLDVATIYIPEIKQGTMSDFQGRFSFENLCAGTYTLQISHIGCTSVNLDVELAADTVLIVHMAHQHVELKDILIIEHHDAFTGNMTIEHIEESELQRLSGLPLGDMLKTLPGVWSLSTGPTISKPVINGLHSNRVLILNNGVRQEAQQWGSEHGPEIDPFIASEITVIRGAAAVRYGSDAMGGVILVQAPALPDSAGITGKVQLAGFSNSIGGASSVMVEGCGEKLQAFAWRIQGTLKGGGDSRTPHYNLTNTGYREANYSLTTGWDAKKFDTEVYYSKFSSKLGILTASHIGNLTDLNLAFEADTPLIAEAFSYQIEPPYQNIEHQLLKSFTTIPTGSIGHLDLTVSYQDNQREEYDQDRNAEKGPSLDFRIQTVGVDVVWKHLSRRKFFLGEYLNGSLGVSYQNQQNTWQGRYFIPNFIQHAGGVYLIEKWTHGSWTAEAGIRYDLRQLDVYRNNGVSIDRTIRQFYDPSWSISVANQLSEKWSILLYTGTAWRAPAINELYAAGLHHGAAALEYGDENLQKEQVWYSAVSVDYTSSKWTFDGSVFYNRFHEFIYLEPQAETALTIAGAFPVFAYQQTDATLSGMDLLLKYQWRTDLGFEFSGNTLLARNSTEQDWIIQMPADRLRAGLHWHIHRREIQSWDLRASVLHVFEQKRVPGIADFAAPPGSYTTLQGSLESGFMVGETTWRWSVEVTNLGNAVYRDYLNRYRYFADETGRNFIVRLFIPFTLKN